MNVGFWMGRGRRIDQLDAPKNENFDRSKRRFADLICHITRLRPKNENKWQIKMTFCRYDLSKLPPFRAYGCDKFSLLTVRTRKINYLWNVIWIIRKLNKYADLRKGRGRRIDPLDAPKNENFDRSKRHFTVFDLSHHPAQAQKWK